MRIHFNWLASLLTFTKNSHHQLFTWSTRTCYTTLLFIQLQTQVKQKNKSNRSTQTLTWTAKKPVWLPLVTTCPSWQCRCGNLKKKKIQKKFGWKEEDTEKHKQLFHCDTTSHWKWNVVQEFLNRSSNCTTNKLLIIGAAELTLFPLAVSRILEILNLIFRLILNGWHDFNFLS